MFKLVSNLDGSYSFLAEANGYFVCADNSGSSPLIANKMNNQQWESFILTPNPDSSFSIESQANWRFVGADNAGQSPLIANKDSASTWEVVIVN